MFPKIDAAEPKSINTIEKPKVKKTVLTTNRFLFLLLSWSKDVPEIQDMYPGIRGSTHGDKKLIKPAKKAIDNEVFI